MAKIRVAAKAEPEDQRRHLKHLTKDEAKGGPERGTPAPLLGKNQCAYFRGHGPKNVARRES